MEHRTRLLDLPLEILDGILEFSLPFGIESFAATCRAVRARAAPLLQRHSKYKRRWKHARVTGSVQNNALQVLHEMARDPLIAHYVESLSLWAPAGDTSTEAVDADQADEYRMQDEAMQLIRALVEDSPSLDRAGVNSADWWEALKNEDSLAREAQRDYEDSLCTIVALLANLPQLTTLRLSPAWSDLRPLEDADDDETIRLVSILDAMVEDANQGDTPSRPLARLHTIMPFMSEGYDERAGLQSLLPFLTLNSLKEVFVTSCIAVDDSYTGIPFRWRSSGCDSSLTRLELAYCCIDADGISALISHTPCLKVFRYSHQTKWHGCLHDWNPGTFNEALARHCGRTLIDLALTIDEFYGEVENGASSFLSFPNLEYLEVDVLIFCGPPVESGQIRGMSSSIPEGQTPWIHQDIPCIGSMLPDSIVEVQINTDFPDPDEDALTALLKNIIPQREERLKQLDKVVIRQRGPDTVRQLANTHCVTVEVFDEEERPRSMMPQWKRDFERRVGIGFL